MTRRTGIGRVGSHVLRRQGRRRRRGYLAESLGRNPSSMRIVPSTNSPTIAPSQNGSLMLANVETVGEVVASSSNEGEQISGVDGMDFSVPIVDDSQVQNGQQLNVEEEEVDITENRDDTEDLFINEDNWQESVAEQAIAGVMKRSRSPTNKKMQML